MSAEPATRSLAPRSSPKACRRPRSPICSPLRPGRIDFIKDDHAPCRPALRPVSGAGHRLRWRLAPGRAETGHPTRYVPNVSGNLDQLREQASIALGEGLDTLLIAPMLVGLPAFHTIRRENPGMAFIAHPAFAGAARIAPQLLLGKLFRLFGADAVIFPHHGGRFGYSSATCAALADIARAPLGALLPSMPVPAGGMTLDRLAEILKFYGEDMMILIGGGLLAAGDRLTEQAASFVAQVEALSAER